MPNLKSEIGEIEANKTSIFLNTEFKVYTILRKIPYDSLNNLMLISILVPDNIKEFDHSSAIKQWKSKVRYF